ncbi:MAG: ATP-binding protein [Candidatus Nanopelagicales bacterium]
MLDQHLTDDDMPLFTRLRMTAFGEAVIDIANDPTCDQWTFSQKIRHALERETAARGERRLLKLLKASRTPNPAACVEDIHYLHGRSINRDVVARLAACHWIDRATNLVILGTSSVGKSYLAQALVNAACRRDYTARYYRLDDLANRLAVFRSRRRATAALPRRPQRLRPAGARRLPHHPDHQRHRSPTAQHPRRTRGTRLHRRHLAVRPRGLVQIPARRRDRGVHPEPDRLQRRDRATRRAKHAPPHIGGNNASATQN